MERFEAGSAVLALTGASQPGHVLNATAPIPANAVLHVYRDRAENFCLGRVKRSWRRVRSERRFLEEEEKEGLRRRILSSPRMDEENWRPVVDM